MAKIHFVKEGKTPNGERLTATHPVSSDLVRIHLRDQAVRFYAEPPTINAERTASQLAEYKYVVVEIEEGEAGLPPFLDEGFYFLMQLKPADCRTLLGLQCELV